MGGGRCLFHGDFNGDGLDDIGTCEAGLRVGISLGDGTFRPRVLDTNSYLAVAAADLNGDGLGDVLTSWLRFFRSNRDGSFGPARTLLSGVSSGASICLKDLDGDGYS